MMLRNYGWMLASLAVTVVAWNVAQGDEAKAAPAKDVGDTVVTSGKFKILATALKAADLVETLKGKGPFTVFAPTDEAFSKLPPGALDDLLKPENKKKLAGILTYHVAATKMSSAQVAAMTTAKSVNGAMLTIAASGGKVSIDKANVVQADIECSNGVIHAIDAVLMPK